jgi:hypothetical protein
LDYAPHYKEKPYVAFRTFMQVGSKYFYGGFRTFMGKDPFLNNSGAAL